MRTLIATDLSSHAEEAIRQGLARASGVRGAVAVCHVLPEVSQYQAFFPEGYVLDLESHVDRVPKIVEAVREQVDRIVAGAGDQIEVLIEEGPAYAGIIRRAEEWKAELIVVGSGEKKAVERFFLGSVAERVVRYAHAPVLVARPLEATTILVATDLSDPSLPAIEAGVREAAWRGSARLVILHVNEVTTTGIVTPFMGAAPLVLPDELLQERRAAARELIEGAVARLGAEAQVEVVDGDPPTEILARAAELPAALLIVGTHGRTGLSRFVLGSVAERLVRDSSCSVLAVRLVSD